MIKKWFKNLIKDVLKEEIGLMLVNKPLSKDSVNIVYVPIGNLPKNKEEIFIKDVQKNLHETNPDYKFLLIGVPGEVNSLIDCRNFISKDIEDIFVTNSPGISTIGYEER